MANERVTREPDRNTHSSFAFHSNEQQTPTHKKKLAPPLFPPLRFELFILSCRLSGKLIS